MRNDLQLRRFWCVLTVGILLMSILPDSNWVKHVISPYVSYSWVHFLLYAAAVAIPFAFWKARSSILFSFSAVILGIILEALTARMSCHFDQSHSPLVGLFGVAAGVLLGLNLRTMRAPVKSPSNVSSGHSPSAML